MRARRSAFGDALSTGLTLSTGLYPATLLLFAVEALDVSASLLALVSLFAGAWRLDATLAFGGLMTVSLFWLAAQLLRPIVIAGALRQAIAVETEGRALSFSAAVAEQAGKGAAFFAYSLYAGALIGTFNALSIATTFLAWVWLLGEGHSGISSFAFALALVVAIFLGFFGRLWLRMGLVRAVVSGQPILPSLYDALGQLGRDPLRPAGVLLIFGSASGLIEGALTGTFASLTRRVSLFEGAEAFLVGFAVPLAGAIVAAFASAYILHAQWQALLRLELQKDGRVPLSVSEGEALVPYAEPIIPALPVDEPEPTPEPH